MSIELAPTILGAPVRRWKRYPAYRNSGVEWIGAVPEEWEIKKVKRMCLVKRGASPRPIDDPIYFDDEGDYSWVRISDVTASTKYLQITEQKLSVLGMSKSVPLEPGELFLSIAGSVGKPILTAIKCCIHDGFVYFVGLKSNRHYMYYIFLIGGLYKGLGKFGTQLNLNTDTIGDIKIPVPSFPEQRAIAAFLDRETGRIDTLIEKKERQVELLQEKRGALIIHTVTKGLSPDFKRKDSGVEWLGEVPEHWEIMNLKRIGKVRYGLGQPPSELNDGVPLIRATNINRGKISDEGMLFINPDEVPESRDAVLSEGEIIIVRSGAYTGDSAIIPFKYAGAIAGYDTVLTIKKGINRYFAWQILSKEIQDLQFGFNKLRAAQPHLNAEEINETIIVNPLLEEQRTIAAFLDRETERIDTLTIKVRESLSKLREYRTALISAAVTGKIDVRGEFVS